MADFKTALIALSNGEIAYQLIEKNIGTILNRNPALAVSIIEQLQDAFNAGIIDAELYARFKSYVTQLSARENPEVTIAHEVRQAIAPSGDIDLALDFDLSPITENPGRQHAGVDTSWPNHKKGKRTPSKSEKIDAGTVIRGRFQLDKVLGVGGMGTVFRGRDLIKVEARDKNPYVALKILNEDFKDHPDGFIALQREASRQQKLAHPNITTVHDFDRTEDGTFYLTMELLEGQPLNRYIKKVVRQQKGLPFEQAFPMIEGLANALIYAHERDIVHSDFKPGNCFITTDGTMKVLDFGIARAVKTPGQSDTEKTIFDPGKLGALTPPYASVEMLEEQEPDTRDDIYALACVAYELLSGKHPFNKLRATTARDNNLVPMPIKGLKKHQMQALNRGLGFTREERSQTVREFLEELRGRPSRFGNPWITIPSVAVILAAVSIFPMIGMMKEREIDRLVESLRSGEPFRVEETLAQLRQPAVDASVRDRVLVASRNEVLDHYDTQIAEKINVSANRIDLGGARALITDIGSFSVFSDSAQVEQWRNRLRAVESDLLNQKSAEFNEALVADRLLDLDGQNDVHDILIAAQQIDPELAQNFRMRLPGAYAAAIQRAIVNEEFERAVSLSQAGLKLFPGQDYLTNLSEQIAGAQERVQHQAEITQLSNRIRDAVDVASGLSDLANIQKDAQILAFFVPDSPVLQELRNMVTGFVAKQTAQLQSGKPENVTTIDLTDYGLLFRSLGLTTIGTQHSQRLQRIEGELLRLSTELRAQILNPTNTIHSPGVASLIVELTEFSGHHPIQEDALKMTAHWALGAARRARSLGDLSAAQTDLDRLSALIDNRIPLPHVIDEKQIITALENHNAVHYVQNSDAQQLQFDRQAAAFAKNLNAPPSNIDTLETLINGFDALAATDPASTRLAGFRHQVIEQTHIASRNAKVGGNRELAKEYLSELLVYFPDDQATSSALNELRADIARESKNLANNEVGAIKEELEELLTTAEPDRTWNNRVQQLLLQLEQSSQADTEWIEEIKPKISDVLRKAAAEAIDNDEFALASTLLWRAEPYIGDPQRLDEQRTLLEAAEQEFVIQHRLRERQARIAGLRRDFDTQVAALDIANATKSYVALQQASASTNEFLAHQAPSKLAGAYLQVAEEAISRDDHATALEILKAGANTLPDDTNIRTAIERSRVKGNSQELTRLFAIGGEFDLAAALDRIEEIETSDPDFFSSRQMNWALAIAKRFTTLQASADPGRREFTDQLSRAKQIFAEDPMIQNLSFNVEHRTPAAQLADDIAAAQTSGLLSHARQLLGQLEVEQRNLSEFAALITNQQKLTNAARTHFTQYKLAIDSDDKTGARGALKQALDTWRDNKTFIEENHRWDKLTNGTGDTVNVRAATNDAKCMHKLAGRGKRLTGTCYDMLSSTTRGPLLVVIPAEVKTRGLFAMGKFEITIGDFNAYCKSTGDCEPETKLPNNLAQHNISK
ncbi:MAG: serine/threonine-protein kinase, partial [Gammaproteobacteria bacterium]